MRAVALGLGESADGKLLLRHDLDFDPLAAAFRFVSTGGAFGDETFEAVLARGFQQLFASAREDCGDAEYGVRRDYLFEQLAALVQMHAAQIVSVEIEQIESEIHHRRGARHVRNGVRIGIHDARLNQVKLRDALGIEHGDFAVQHRRFRRHLVRNHGQLRILPLATISGARLQMGRFVFDQRDCADAIPLHFEQPAVAARRTLRDLRLHRLDGRRHLRLACALQAAWIDFRIFFLGAGVDEDAAAVFADFAAPRAAGRLLAHTRSAAPAVLRFDFFTGRLRAISSWVRPDSALWA